MAQTQFTRERWSALCTRLGCAAAIDRFDQLSTAYAEPVRAYHTAQHIDECLLVLDSVASQLQSPDDVELAIWLHDVVYDPQAKDNEARSAALAVDWFKNLAQARKDSLHQRILATRRHLPTPDDSDCQALLDIDLAILAAPPARFAEYAEQVRTEYGFVPEPIYQTKRAEFMRAMAQRPQLYFHPALAPRLEPLARRNLA
jgi:predicted metal-dependent HD superfamily phosphohydrolase